MGDEGRECARGGGKRFGFCLTGVAGPQVLQED